MLRSDPIILPIMEILPAGRGPAGVSSAACLRTYLCRRTGSVVTCLRHRFRVSSSLVLRLLGGGRADRRMLAEARRRRPSPTNCFLKGLSSRL